MYRMWIGYKILGRDYGCYVSEILWNGGLYSVFYGQTVLKVNVNTLVFSDQNYPSYLECACTMLMTVQHRILKCLLDILTGLGLSFCVDSHKRRI